MTPLSFFGFLTNLEQSGGRILDIESAKVMFSVIVPFCLAKTENRTKKPLTQFSRYCFEEICFFGIKALFFLQKNADYSKIKGA